MDTRGAVLEAVSTYGRVDRTQLTRAERRAADALVAEGVLRAHWGKAHSAEYGSYNVKIYTLGGLDDGAAGADREQTRRPPFER